MKILDFSAKKERGEKITVLTCYDYATARILKETALDCLLVGDTVSMVVHGFENTTYATMEMMLLHVQSVKRASPRQFIIGDMPFMSYQVSEAESLRNVQRMIQAGANAVKLEGASQSTVSLIEKVVESGVPVIGHLGLTPQSIHQLGGHKVQGKERKSAELLIEKAKELQAAGCCALVLECVPNALANEISTDLKIPTIGIGAGPNTDGQVLVINDMLGMDNAFCPRFLKQYANHQISIFEAVENYVKEVKSKAFPDLLEHSYQ
jgi:3-methyl-2-oxobutanoate hydroxymethyltransferase